jgi:hypothetical protein
MGVSRVITYSCDRCKLEQHYDSAAQLEKTAYGDIPKRWMHVIVDGYGTCAPNRMICEGCSSAFERFMFGTGLSDDPTL